MSRKAPSGAWISQRVVAQQGKNRHSLPHSSLRGDDVVRPVSAGSTATRTFSYIPASATGSVASTAGPSLIRGLLQQPASAFGYRAVSPPPDAQGQWKSHLRLHSLHTFADTPLSDFCEDLQEMYQDRGHKERQTGEDDHGLRAPTATSTASSSGHGEEEIEEGASSTLGTVLRLQESPSPITPHDVLASNSKSLLPCSDSRIRSESSFSASPTQEHQPPPIHAYIPTVRRTSHPLPAVHHQRTGEARAPHIVLFLCLHIYVSSWFLCFTIFICSY